uniref:Zinc finger protein 292b n=1 Tax=Nothobranchius furzeri TaxID=105023 RepID=A0A8C6M5Q8_NOTFU
YIMILILGRRWKQEEEPLLLVQVYVVGLLSYAKASPYLNLQCENVPLVVERLSLFSEQLKLSKQKRLRLVSVEEFLLQEGPVLLQMRVKQLMKEKQMEKAALLAKTCSESSAFQGKGAFKQMYLVCLCATLEQDQLMEELSKEDCKDALEMICNLDSEGDDGAAFTLCSAFLTRQFLHGDTYCAWELTLFWSKLLKRLESSEQAFLDKCQQMSLASKSAYHILFLIKVIQSELDGFGLPVCIEMCIRALKMTSDDVKARGAVCKTMSCLLPTDLEVKRACQLTEFLLEPTVDAYYAVGTLYNEPDQKLEEENMPISNSLRCELLLVLKTLWPFDPEFWDWKTLKRHCLALMGEEASIVSSIDSLNEPETPEEEEEYSSLAGFNITDYLTRGTFGFQDGTDKKRKNQEIKKLRQKGLVSGRFRNWQAYMQYCVLCDKEFLGHRIVRHAQTHLSNGVYSCPICTETFATRDTLIPHVTSHVKQSSKERLSSMKTNNSLVDFKTSTLPPAASKAKTLNQLHKNKSSFRQKAIRTKSFKPPVKREAEISEDNMCPVGQCRRSFKFFKNLIAHIKDHGDNEEAKTFLELWYNKVVCQYCRRHFISVTHLNDHLQAHCGVKPYICVQLNCKACFATNTELLVHKKTHTIFKARCMFPNCGKIFNAAFKLYDHEAHHYRTFTCKDADCGKVFHSQQQLDLHLDNHNAQKNKIAIPSQSSTNIQSGSSLGHQMSSNPSLPKQDENLNSGDTGKTNPGKPLLSIESLLKSSQEPKEMLKQGKAKCDHPNPAAPTSQMYTSNNSVIQSVRSHLDDLNRRGEVHQSLECAMPQQRKHSVLAFEASVQKLQNQPQLLPSNVNTQAVRYNSNGNISMPLLHGSMSCRSMLTVSLSRLSAETAMSQPLPPTVSPKQPTRSKPENSTTPSNITGPAPGHRERFHCAFPTCERHYSSYKNVTKHMKVVHSDFYEQWKLSRTEIKKTYGPVRRTPSMRHLSSASFVQNKNAKGVQTPGSRAQNVIQSPPYIDGTKSSNCPNSLPVLQSSPPNVNGSVRLANNSKPIAVSHPETDRNLTSSQSRGSGSKSWNSVSGSEQVHNSRSSPAFQSNQKAMSRGSSITTTLPLNVPTCSMIGSTKNTEALLPQLNSRPQSTIPSCIKHAKEVLQHVKSPSSCTPSVPSASKTLKKTRASQEQPNFSSFEANKGCKDSQPQYGFEQSEKSPNQKRSRKYTRTKCPAIIKDGKVFCRRCFRQFASPKSLGGHLSKRTTCKPYQESELNSDLPQSFLNLLNSEDIVGTSESQPPYTCADVYQKSNKMVTSGSLSTKDFSTPNNIQEHLDTYENGESSDDILKQIMAESNMTDLFIDPPIPQPLFQNPCAPYGVSEHLLGSSVIQHTEKIQLKPDTNPYSAGCCPQPGSSRFPENKFPAPLFSQLLPEPPSTIGMGSDCKSNTIPPGIQGAGNNPKTIEPKLNAGSKSVMQTIFDGPLGRAIMGCGQMDGQRKVAEKNIKKKLREQILAGDFHRRNILCHSGNSDSKTSPGSSGLAASPSTDCGFQQYSHDANSGSVIKGQAFEGTYDMIPDSSGGIEPLLNSQSFTCFRETATMHEERPSPPAISLSIPDPEPAVNSENNQPCLTEIQFAFERLDLFREKSEQLSTSVKESSTHASCQMASPRLKSRRSTPSTIVKKLACENCSFSSVSGESLWKHLSKVHNYTIERVNEVKRRLGLYAPFKCLKCTKAFTRNSNLRSHYLSIHKLSNDEIAELDMKRKEAKAAAACTIQNQPQIINHSPVTQIPKSPRPTVGNGECLYPLQDAVKREQFVPNISAAFNDPSKPQGDNHCSVIRPLQTLSMHSLEMAPSAQTSAAIQAGMASERLSKSQRNVPKIHSQQVTSPPFPVIQDLSVTLTKAKGPFSNKKGSLSRPDVLKPNVGIPKKARGRKPKQVDSASPYRPYRCVHQGCVAAFAIQHNLILHYRAVHQSALSALEVNEEQDQCEGAEATDCPKEKPEPEVPQATEFRCQVTDCCCIFQEVPNLFLHYIHLHEFTVDKVGSLLSDIKLGKFTCGHQGCTESFKALRKYISHVKEEHKDLNLGKCDLGQVSFRCEVEGCDRSYATKSNMLRHLMKKHNDLYLCKLKKDRRKEEQTKPKSKILHYQMTKPSNGKENIESNKKILLRQNRTKRLVRPKKKHWLKYGNPSLKSKLEAAALCTKKFPLQYACMIKSCTSVMKSERSILKHYVGHGLSEKYLEQHRSHFIFCKKFSKLRCRSIRSDDSKSDNTSDLSDETTSDSILEGGGSESSKPVLRRRTSTGIPVVLFNTKLSADESSNGSVVLKRKRGRPRKFSEKLLKRKKVFETTKSDPTGQQEEEEEEEEEVHSSGGPAVVPESAQPATPLALFKPMGFEMSFLKFLEQSKSESSTKPVSGKTLACSNLKNTRVKFSNRQNIKSLGKVRIHLDASFSGVTDSMLKQLQDMRPAVRFTCGFNSNPIMSNGLSLSSLSLSSLSLS